MIILRDMVQLLFIYIIAYLAGLITAKILYRYGGYDRDSDVVWWSWIGVFVILLSLLGGGKS